MNKTRKLSLLITIMLAAVALQNCCDAHTAPSYKVGPDTTYQGSLLYVEAGCQSCHGLKWDGQSEEAELLKSNKGLTVTDFTKASGKTTVDYFKTITAGNEQLEAKGVNHSYQNYTDGGRWAIAHFLYSLSPADAARNDANSKALEEVKAIYSALKAKGLRRWVIGFKPAEERSKPPLLAKLAPEVREINNNADVDNERAVEISQKSGRGADLYRTNCVLCHGAYGQGKDAGERAGIYRCNEAGAKEGKANCSTYVIGSDISRADNAKFARAHRNQKSNAVPTFATITDSELNEIFNYLR